MAEEGQAPTSGENNKDQTSSQPPASNGAQLQAAAASPEIVVPPPPVVAAPPPPIIDVPRPSYYSEIRLSPTVDDPRSLVLVAVAGAGKVPDALLALRKEYDVTSRVVSVLFDQEKAVRAEIFGILHMAADRAFRGPDYNLEDGAANLSNVRDTITDRAHSVRDKRLKVYTILAVLFGIVPLGLGLGFMLSDGLGHFPVEANGEIADQTIYAWILAAFWIPAGAAICVWAEFALRMQAGLSFDQLLNMDPSRWRPGQRVIITVGIAFIFAYLLAFNVFQVGIGGVLLNDFLAKEPLLALAVGGVTGLAFIAVRDLIIQAKPVERK